MAVPYLQLALVQPLTVPEKREQNAGALAQPLTAAEKKREQNVRAMGTVAHIIYVDEFNCSAITHAGSACKKLALYFSTELDERANTVPHYCSQHLAQNSKKLLSKIIKQKLTLQSRQLVKHLSQVKELKYQWDTHPCPAPDMGEGWFKRHSTSTDFVKDIQMHYERALDKAKRLQSEMIVNRAYLLSDQDVRMVREDCYVCSELCQCIELMCRHTVCYDCLSQQLLKGASNSCGICRASIC